MGEPGAANGGRGVGTAPGVPRREWRPTFDAARLASSAELSPPRASSAARAAYGSRRLSNDRAAHLSCSDEAPDSRAPVADLGVSGSGEPAIRGAGLAVMKSELTCHLRRWGGSWWKPWGLWRAAVG